MTGAAASRREGVPAAGSDEALILPAKRNRHVAGGLRWYTRRILRRQFHAVRAISSVRTELESLASSDRPAMLMLTHSSWWDPLIAIDLWNRYFPKRRLSAPMHRRELERFGFFRAVGVFGIDPDEPRSLAAMRDYLQPRLSREAAGGAEVLVLTPQGALTDPRVPMRLRPGAAAIAASVPDLEVISIAIEYAFWSDRLPEVFLHAQRCPPPNANGAASTARWHRTLQESLAEVAEALAAAVASRDPDRFERLDGGASTVHPVYDWWLRATGRSGGIDGEGRARRSSR